MLNLARGIRISCRIRAQEGETMPDNIINSPYGAETAEEDVSMSCCHKKVRSDKEIKDLMNRLNRIEGQIRGIKRMLEEDAYCIDIINQVSAANCALNSFTKVILANHIKSCVAEDVKEGSEEKLDELVRTLQKLMK